MVGRRREELSCRRFVTPPSRKDELDLAGLWLRLVDDFVEKLCVFGGSKRLLEVNMEVMFA